MSTIGHCGGYDEPTSDWKVHAGPATGYRYCDSCWVRHRELPDMSPGCERRLEFYRWLFVSGKISEWPSGRAVLN